VILALFSLCCTVAIAPVDDVAAFKTAFRHHAPHSQLDGSDKAIAKCLAIISKSVKTKWQAGSKDDAQDVSAFEQAAKSVDGKPGDMTEPAFIVAKCEERPGVRFIVVEMGQFTRTTAFDTNWKPLKLPEEFACNYLWDVDPTLLPSGMWLMYSGAIQHGNKVGVKLVFLRRKADALVKVGSFEGESVLEFMEPLIHGDRVTIISSDEPKAFRVVRASPMLERETTWDCSCDKPKVIYKELRDQELRAIDKYILAAHSAKKRTSDQELVRHVWGKYQFVDPNEEEHLLTLLPNGNTKVVFHGFVFEVKPGPHEWTVVGVKKGK